MLVMHMEENVVELTRAEYAESDTQNHTSLDYHLLEKY